MSSLQSLDIKQRSATTTPSPSVRETVQVAKLIDVLTFAIVRRHAAKKETRLDDFLVELFHGPVKVVASPVLDGQTRTLVLRLEPAPNMSRRS